MFELTYKPHVIVGYLSYALCVWFFICAMSPKKIKVSSSVLFVLYMISSHWAGVSMDFDGSQNYYDVYFKNIEFLVMIDGATILILTMFMKSDRNAAKLALIMVFAVTCHTMILYDYTVKQTLITGVFYNWYDELIITVGLLLMAASYDGFITSLRSIQGLLYRVIFHNNRASEGVSSQQRRKEKET